MKTDFLPAVTIFIIALFFLVALTIFSLNKKSTSNLPTPTLKASPTATLAPQKPVLNNNWQPTPSIQPTPGAGSSTTINNNTYNQSQPAPSVESSPTPTPSRRPIPLPTIPVPIKLFDFMIGGE